MTETVVLGPGLQVEVGPNGIVRFFLMTEEDTLVTVATADLDPGWEELLEKALRSRPAAG